MNLFIRLIAIFFVLCSTNSFSENEENALRLRNTRVRAIRRTAIVAQAQDEFIKQTKAILAAPIESTPEKLVFYQDSRTYFRKKIPQPGAVWDPVDIICNDEDLKKQESIFLEQRKQFSEMLASKEKATRLISIISDVISTWKGNMKLLGPAFKVICGLNEECLEKKQLNRLKQINATAIAHYNLVYIRNLIPKEIDAETQVGLTKVAAKSVTTLELELHKQFETIASRRDLPW